MKPFTPEQCESCGQSKQYLLPIDRGSVATLIAIAQAIKKKGINVIHPTKELVKVGLLKPNQVNNISRIRKHGLVASLKGPGNRGNYILTKKGASFLRGLSIPRIVIADKCTKKSVGYWDAETETCTINDFRDSSLPYWEGIGFEIEEGRVINTL